MNRPLSGKTAPVKTHLVLLLWGSDLAAWLLTPGEVPRPLMLQGQTRLGIKQPAALAAATADVAERLRGEGIQVAEVHWLADAVGRQLWRRNLPLEDFTGSPPWQLLAWEWLAGRFGCSDTSPWEATDLLTGTILPWLITSDDGTERRQIQEALAREHHGEAERLAAERARLQQENESMRSQNAALQQVDTERLVSFLPALFPRVFTILGAADLALLCGRVEPLAIPNPYPEPSEEALRTLQKDFRLLPRALQRQIVGFVARLPQRQKLQPRPEMRALLHELEGN